MLKCFLRLNISAIDSYLQLHPKTWIAIFSSNGQKTERGRFELPLPLRADRFSKPAHSTTLPPLQNLTFPSIKALIRTFIR
jgi:hypothetical protein